MRYPKFLPKAGENGCIGYVAPSFGCATEPYQSAFSNAGSIWSKMKYWQIYGPNCRCHEGVGISNTPEKCGREIMHFFLSGEADCLISCGGGELMCEILPYVDFEKLAEADPVWFMGFSDNTNLTYLLATLTDTASVYGPNAPAFGMEPWHKSLFDAYGILTGEQTVVESYGMWEKESLKNEENPLVPYHLTEPLAIRSFVGKEEWKDELRFDGRLLGGCMDCLVNLLGTRFDRTREFVERYKEDGIIWFLEACDLNVFSIRRAMWQMEEAGWFRYVKGFLFGRPLNGAPMMGLDEYHSVLEVAGRKNVPVVMDVDLGHLPPMMPLVVGSLGEITVKNNHLKIEMKYK